MNNINKIKPPTAKARLHRLDRRHCGQAVMAVRGFTLIELIVAVTIISILTVVGLVSFTGTNKRARDTRRIADLTNIRMALELYRQGTGNTYPASSALSSSLVSNYIEKIPVGPKNESYSYTKITGYTYRICARVEDVGSTSADVLGCTAPLSGYVGYYKVTNP